MLKYLKIPLFLSLFFSIFVLNSAYSQKLGLINKTKEEIKSMPKGSIDSNNLQTLSNNLKSYLSQNGVSQNFPQNITPQIKLPQLENIVNPQNIQNTSGHSVGAIMHINQTNNTPYFISNISFKVKSKDNSPKLQSSAIPINYIKENANLFKLNSPETELKIKNAISSNDGKSHLTYNQYYNDIPIWGKELVFHFDANNEIYMFNGRYVPTPTKIQNNGFTLSSDNSIAIAIKDLKQFVPIETFDKQVSDLLKYTLPTANKYIWTNDDNTNFHYAWLVNVRPNVIDNWYYFIDSETGEILEKYNATQSDGRTKANATDLKGNNREINVYNDNGTYQMIDVSRPMYNNNFSSPEGIIYVMDNGKADLTQSANPRIVTSTNNQWTDKSSVSAQYNMGLIYEWYKNNLSRNSFDDKGASMMTMIHVTSDGVSMDNAYWNGQFVVLGDGGTITTPWAAALDFHAHEFTHAIVSFTVDLEYKNQSGALNEALADWGGCMVDREDWKLGEDIANPLYFPTQCMRNMEDPHNGGTKGDYSWQPAHMNEFQNRTLEEDNGGVHINCGIINKATYLIGSSLGREKLEKIYYRVLLQKYITKQAQFIDFRLGCVKAAEELYGNNSSEVQIVKNSFDQVGITDGTSTNPNPELSPNEGNQFIAFVNSDNANLWIGKPQITNINTDVQQLTNTVVYTGNGCVITTPDNGSTILFIDKDNYVRAILPNGTSEQVLSQTGEYRTIALSPDGKYLAATSIYTDPNIYLFDLNSGSSKAIPLYIPNTGDDSTYTQPLFPNSLTWNIDNRTLVYDAVNYSVDAWDNEAIYMEMNALDVPTATIYRIFPPMDKTISIGAPSFAHNDQNHLVFQVYNSTTQMYFINGLNLFTGDLANIVYSQATTANLSSPNYSTLDNRLVFQIYLVANQTFAIQQIPLKNDKITPSGNIQAYLTGCGIPYWFANGTRSSVENEYSQQSAIASIYPNPTSGNFSVNLKLMEDSRVSVSIMNVLGEEIKVLSSNEYIPSGEHTLNYSNEMSSANLQQGIYFIKLNINDQSQIQKLEILR
jgi:Zn-dependent metalloprotease